MSQKQKNNKNRSNAAPKNIQAQELAVLKQLLALEMASSQPPRWLANKPISQEVRYGCTANQSETNYRVRELLYATCLAVSSTVLVPLAYAVRLRRIRIWFQSPTLGSSITSTIEWSADTTGFLMNGSSVSEVNSSTTEPVMLEARPPKGSLARWYQSGVTGATNVLFSFSAPAGATIAIDYDWVVNRTEASYETLVTAGATANTICCRAVNATCLVLPPLNSVV